MGRRTVSTLGFEDLAVGDEWESPARTITEADITAFAGISGDFNPLHVDHAFAASGPFARPIAHGLLGLSVSSGLVSHAPRVATLAFLAILEWKFLRPVFPGDTVRVISAVVEVLPRSRGRRALVTWRRQLVNQHDEVLQEGLSQTLVRSRHLQREDRACPPNEQPQPQDDQPAAAEPAGPPPTRENRAIT